MSKSKLETTFSYFHDYLRISLGKTLRSLPSGVGAMEDIHAKIVATSAPEARGSLLIE